MSKRKVIRSSYKDRHGKTRPMAISDAQNEHVYAWLERTGTSWSDLMRRAEDMVRRATKEEHGSMGDVRDVAMLLTREPQAMARHRLHVKAVQS